MRFNRLVVLAMTFALTAMVLAACGDDDAADTTTAPASTAATATTAAPGTTAAAATTVTTSAPATTAGEASGPIEVTIAATSFSVEEIRVKAGEEVTIVVTDTDAETDAPHNFHVRAGDLNFFTNIQDAPNTQTLTFTINEPGTYEFFCDTHLVEMSGAFIVE